jgi:hypothetical protein
MTTTPTSSLVADKTFTKKCSTIYSDESAGKPTGCQLEFTCDGCILHDDASVTFAVSPNISRQIDMPFASAASFNLTVGDMAGEVSSSVGAVLVPDGGALLTGLQTIQLDLYHSSFIDSAVVPWKGSKYTFLPGGSLILFLVSNRSRSTARPCIFSSVSSTASVVHQAH